MPNLGVHRQTKTKETMKRIALLIVTLLVSLNFYAQLWDNAKPDQRFTFGVRAGINLSTIIPDGNDYYDYPKFKSKLQFHAGVTANLNVINSFAVETGLLFSQKGADMDSTSGWMNYKVYIQYLQIPIMAKAKLYISPTINIQLKAGPYFSFKLSDPDESLGGSHLELKSIDYGLAFGGGVSIRKIYVGAQYELALSDLGWYKDRKNRCLSISVGYDF